MPTQRLLRRGLVVRNYLVAAAGETMAGDGERQVVTSVVHLPRFRPRPALKAGERYWVRAAASPPSSHGDSGLLAVRLSRTGRSSLLHCLGQWRRSMHLPSLR